ncbi:MBL fold metallo-hydrolase [Winogradskyella sp. R77965]|uniref:MBL fold metallo-hydrolase n=1 Tax=Winogradskyella sp. R77965 TaxID=3093872 RepID=UPI0037DD4D6D
MKTKRTKTSIWKIGGENSLCMIMLFLAIIFMSCGRDDGSRGQGNGNEVSLQEVIDALGGIDAFNEVEIMSYSVNAKAFEFEEEEPTQENPILVRNYEYQLSTALNSRKLRLDYTSIESYYPLAYETPGALMLIDDKQGSISGQYDTGSYYFGAVQPRGLHAPRIEAKLKTYVMSNPIELIKQLIVSNTSLDLKTTNGVFMIPTVIEDLYISLHINKNTFLPTMASTIESDFISGDAIFEIKYENWTNNTLIYFPTTAKYVYDNKMIKEEEYSNVEFNQSTDTTLFDLEAVTQPLVYDTTQSQKGIFHSQWYERYFDFSIAADQPLDLAFVAGNDWLSFGIPDQTVGPNLKIIGRPDIAYWAAAVKTLEGVLIIESPFSPEWSRAIINTVKSPAGYPNEEIIGVVQTHTHLDHYSGVREMASEAGTVYIGENGEQEVNETLIADFDLLPDALSLSSTSTNVQQVQGVLSLDDGAVELHSVTMVASGNNPHSENMLLVYVPEYEAIIQADLFSPGALLAIYAGQTLHPLDQVSKAAFKERAKFLLDYINENELNVSRVIGIHGGLGSIEQLQFVANN